MSVILVAVTGCALLAGDIDAPAVKAAATKASDYLIEQ